MIQTGSATADSNVLAALQRAGLTRSTSLADFHLPAYTPGEVQRHLARPMAPFTLDRLSAFLSPAAGEMLEAMAQASHAVTLQRFGPTMGLYAPLYVSNQCINRCRYCGFNAGHEIPRRRLSVGEAVAEARIIAEEGFRDLLLVAGEDPQFVTTAYLTELADHLKDHFASLSVEIQPLTEAGYAELFAAGIDGVTLYQETYDQRTYREMHPAGPKSSYPDRLARQEYAARAGMRRLGIGALLGLQDWRFETLALGVHAQTLLRHHWRSKVSISFPRLRPAPGVGDPVPHPVSDREMVQMILALRLSFPDLGLVLSTRESASFRDHAIALGITQISAGSRTNPGGYGTEDDGHASGEQFGVADDRPAAEICQMLKARGFDPIWKDWDPSFHPPRE